MGIEKNCATYEAKSKNYSQKRNRKQCQLHVQLKLLTRFLATTQKQKNAEYETLLNKKKSVLNRKSTLEII